MRRSPLVTVTGVGGVGKTRLALHAAAERLTSFRDGAWLCELRAANDGETMAQAILAALRVRPRPGISMASSIVEFLRTKSALLLVVDNCEHLLSAVAALIADILCRCRGVRILATSRQALGVGGEQVFGLRPLSLPPPEASMATVGASDAVSLFVQRATAVRRDFCLSPVNVAVVGEICQRLDGIPLAIELAAARVAALRPAEIAGLLYDRFRLLTGGRADAAGRHQTLQATVEWSYALLGEAERRVFDCLDVFPSSFDAAAAVAVAGSAACSGGTSSSRAGAMDSVFGFALSLAVAIRARNGDLPGALAALQEATVQQHNDGNRLGLARSAVVSRRALDAPRTFSTFTSAPSQRVAATGDCSSPSLVSMDASWF